MLSLIFQDHRNDPGQLARGLGISPEAVELYLSSDVIDLHIESFVWTRVFGYDLTRRHGTGLFGARLYGQVDLPRLREARVTGGVWAITTNPFRRASRRPDLFEENLAHFQQIVESCPK